MEQNIIHRRLHAFYQSKVLNALMMTIVISLLLMAYTKSMLLPVMCASLALAFFIGYSMWLWIKKPKRIVINNWLSNINGPFTLYFLIITALNPTNQWWYITPIALSVVVLFISLVKDNDEVFEI